MASSRRSRRSLALRELSSGPWQLKHLLEMTGRICELKSTGSVTDCFLALAANAAPIEPAAKRVKAVSRARAGIRCFIQFLNAVFWQHSILYQLNLTKQPTRAETGAIQSGGRLIRRARVCDVCDPQTRAPNNPKGIAASSPRLACNAYLGCPGGKWKQRQRRCGKRHAPGRKRIGRNRVAVGDVSRTVTQGSSSLATLGFGTESRWDSRTERDSASRSRFASTEMVGCIRRVIAFGRVAG